MNDQIFRKKSMERISSPEQLNAYIRVSSPGVWMVLAAIVILLLGVCVWGITGQLETTLSVAAVAEQGSVTVYIREADAPRVEEGMTLRIAGAELPLSAVAPQPVRVDESIPEYACHVGGLESGQWVYTARAEGSIPDGIHSAGILVEQVKPMRFLLN